MFEIIKAAGWPIYFLLVASVIALALIIERMISLRRQKIVPSTLVDEVLRVYQSGKVKNEVIDQLAQNSPLGRVLAVGLRNAHAPREILKESIEEAGQAVAFLNDLGYDCFLGATHGFVWYRGGDDRNFWVAKCQRREPCAIGAWDFGGFV